MVIIFGIIVVIVVFSMFLRAKARLSYNDFHNSIFEFQSIGFGASKSDVMKRFPLEQWTDQGNRISFLRSGDCASYFPTYYFNSEGEFFRLCVIVRGTHPGLPNRYSELCAFLRSRFNEPYNFSPKHHSYTNGAITISVSAENKSAVNQAGDIIPDGAFMIAINFENPCVAVKMPESETPPSSPLPPRRARLTTSSGCPLYHDATFRPYNTLKDFDDVINRMPPGPYKDKWKTLRDKWQEGDRILVFDSENIAPAGYHYKGIAVVRKDVVIGEIDGMHHVYFWKDNDSVP